ncbi:MAG: anthranilate synthase component I family protein [Campylobacterales bacterium]|nr:anthranilate synthase component I family protein [Campylobacterales bacterium]
MQFRSVFIDQFTPIAFLKKLKDKFKDERIFLLESAMINEYGNYSYIVIGARERVVFKGGITKYTNEDGKTTEIAKEPLAFLQEYYSNIDNAKYQELCRQSGLGFVDGFVGFIGYDVIKEFEPVLKPVMDTLRDETDTPDVDMMRPKIIIGYSHKNCKLTMLSSAASYDGFLGEIESMLLGDYSYEPLVRPSGSFATTTILSDEQFKESVVTAKEHIRAGDVFQILVANRTTVEANVDAYSFYRVLRAKNPSPYMYLLEYEDFSIAGSSPEVMIKLENDEILIRPIAGTRKRGHDIQKDLEMETEMLNDPKERAEHIMLVDLARNDIGRVSKAGSVKVGELMRVERYSHVMHMVSDVTGSLEESKDMFDLFRATFTAGTMTGAPKIKAMEIIARLEGVKRGFYSGSVGYFGFDGNMDFAIAIRTALVKKDKIVFQAGAGVVADSVPELELKEIKNKLAANISSFEDLKNLK